MGVLYFVKEKAIINFTGSWPFIGFAQSGKFYWLLIIPPSTPSQPRDQGKKKSLFQFYCLVKGVKYKFRSELKNNNMLYERIAVHERTFCKMMLCLLNISRIFHIKKRNKKI